MLTGASNQCRCRRRRRRHARLAAAWPQLGAQARGAVRLGNVGLPSCMLRPGHCARLLLLARQHRTSWHAHTYIRTLHHPWSGDVAGDWEWLTQLLASRRDYRVVGHLLVYTHDWCERHSGCIARLPLTHLQVPSSHPACLMVHKPGPCGESTAPFGAISLIDQCRDTHTHTHTHTKNTYNSAHKCPWRESAVLGIIKSGGGCAESALLKEQQATAIKALTTWGCQLTAQRELRSVSCRMRGISRRGDERHFQVHWDGWPSIRAK